MFLVYVSDMIDRLASYASLFVDDVKLMMPIIGTEYCKELLKDPKKLQNLHKVWIIDLKAKKFHVTEIRKCKARPRWEHDIGERPFALVKKDLVEVVWNDLSQDPLYRDADVVLLVLNF